MKLHHLGEVGQEVGQAVIARVRVILVAHNFPLQFSVQRGRPFFEAVVVIAAAVEVDGELA